MNIYVAKLCDHACTGIIFASQNCLRRRMCVHRTTDALVECRYLWEKTEQDISENILNKSYSKKCSHMKHFYSLDKSWTFINHGAFGAALSVAQSEAIRWRELCEMQPLRFNDRHLFQLIIHSIRKLSMFINCPANEIVPLQNCTSGMNSILRSINFHHGDDVVCFSTTYKSTRLMLQHHCMVNNSHLRILTILFPVSNKQTIYNILQKNIYPNTKLIVIDHITSYSSMIMPVIDMALLCRKINPNIIIIIDGAHSMLSQPVSIYPCQVPISTNNHNHDNDNAHVHKSFDKDENTCARLPSISDVADFWLGNCHKWLSSPRGCAVMWIHPSYKGTILPAVLSNDLSYDPTLRQKMFAWDGNRDYSAFLTIPSVLKFWELVPGGPEGCRKHLYSLIDEARNVILHSWNLAEEDLPYGIEFRENSTMALVRLIFALSSISSRHKMLHKR